MPASAPEVVASWFDGRDAQLHTVRLVPAAEDIAMTRGDGTQVHLPRSTLSWIGPRNAPRPLLRTGAGGALVLRGPAAADVLGIPAPLSPIERAWQSRKVAVFCALTLAGLIAASIGWAVPRASEFAAMHLPWRTEAMLGNEVLRVVDRIAVAPSELSPDTRQRVQARFDALARAGGLDGARLEFRDGRKFGPNAFALPGRIVVVTDQLVALMGESPRLDAVFAHELGHAYHRHGARALMRRTGFTIVSGTLLHDPAMMQNAARMAPQLLLQAAHSREAEREADAFAVALLDRAGRSPAAFADAMQLLREEYARRGGSERAHYLSSHPPAQERIDAARDAAQR